MPIFRVNHQSAPAALVLFASSLAMAQSPADAPQLEQVLVTATRQAQSALMLPLSYRGVGGDALAITAPIHPNEIMQRVPGTWISRGNGQESLTALRSPVLTGAGGCGSFLMAADNISLRAPGFCNVNQLFDAHIEQAGGIEVIKGPATALYGTNAMHGVINVLSPAPLDHNALSLAIESGPDDYYRGKLAANAANGAHRINLRATGSTDGGYQDSSGYDQQKLSLRHDYHGHQWQIQSVLEGSNLNQETAGYVRGYKAYKDSQLRKTNPNPEAYRDVWSVRAYSQFSRALDDNLQLEVTPFYRDNSMQFLQHYLPWQAVEKNGHQSFGLRSLLRGDQNNWQWHTGVDLDYSDGWLKEVQAEDFSPNQPAGKHYDYSVDALTAALFGQATWQLGDRWIIDSGLRLEGTYYDYNNHLGDGSACGPEASACRFYRPADRDDDFSDWSGNLGVSYEYRPNQVAFARIASGFRAPETAELYRLQSGQQVANLDSEQLSNLEFGFRGLAAKRLDYSLSAYYMEKDDVIFQDSERQNVSGASTRHRGLEVALDYQLNEQWYAGLDFTLARHNYRNNPNLFGVDRDIKGNDIDTAPHSFGSARLGWRHEETYIEAEWIYMDDYYLDPENDYRYDGHQLVNLRSATALGRGVSVALRVTNLFDTDYAERADVGFGQYRYFVGQPRSVFFELRYQR